MKPEIDPVVPCATEVAAAALHSVIARHVRMKTRVMSESSGRPDHCSCGAGCGPLRKKSSEKDESKLMVRPYCLISVKPPGYGGRVLAVIRRQACVAFCSPSHSSSRVH